MASVSESNSEQQSDETFELLCSPCKRKERNREAQKYCADCNDYYCSDCVKVHDDVPFLSGHKIINKGQEGTRMTLPVAPTDRCERHRFKLVDMFCQNHDDVGCYTCMAVDHRSCKDIFDIPEYVQKKNASTDIGAIREDLRKVKGNLDEKINACKQVKDRLLKSKEEALHSLQIFREEINTRLDELEQISISAVEKEYNILLERINEELSDLVTSHVEAKSADDNLTLIGNNVSQLFVSTKKGKRAVKGATKCSEEISTMKYEVQVHFKKDEKLFPFLERMKSFGGVREPNQLYVIKKKKQYNIRHESDKKVCSISSACLLEDGSIVLADSENQNLKRTDRKCSTIVDVCHLQEKPWQICQVDKETVAVMSSGGKNIYFISVGNEMKITKEIITDHSCYGVTSANGIIYLADGYENVFVYSTSGTKLNQFFKDQTGLMLFKDLYGLAVSGDGMRIYITDNTFGLVVLNKDGTLQGKYKCEELGGARRVCEAENGSVLVRGNTKNYVLQFTSDGKKLGNVLASDKENDKCLAICFDSQRNKLIVGRVKTDVIDMFDLS